MGTRYGDRGPGRPYVHTRVGTVRELDVLAHYALCGSYKETARDLKIGVTTVKKHLSSLYHKLDASNVFEAFTALGWLVIPEHHGACNCINGSGRDASVSSVVTSSVIPNRGRALESSHASEA